MPGRKVKSPLAKKLGGKLRASHEQHKDDEIKISAGGDLPPGIEGGIAEVVLCKFDNYAEDARWAGEYYWMAQAVVIEPKEYAGLRTRIGPEPICEMPDGARRRNTIDSQVAWIYNELRKLGVDTKEMDVDDLESVATAIEESRPHIRFRTWSGQKLEVTEKNGKYYVTRGNTEVAGPYKSEQSLLQANPYVGRDPIVNHDWRGTVDYEPEASQEAVVDNTEEEKDEAPWEEDDANEEQAVTVADLKKLAKAADDKQDTKAMEQLQAQAKKYDIDSDNLESWEAVADAIAEAADDGGDVKEDEDEISLQDLGDFADEGDEDAQTKITAAGERYGVADEYQTWAEWAQAIVEARTNGESNGLIPEVDQIFMYKPKGKRTAVEHKVTAVFEGKETCNLRNTSTGAVVRSVAWDQLIES